MTDEEMFYKSEAEVEEYMDAVVYPVLLKYHHLQILRYGDNTYSTVVAALKKMYILLRDSDVSDEKIRNMLDDIAEDYELGDSGVVLH